jgi:O-antigen ligase
MTPTVWAWLFAVALGVLGVKEFAAPGVSPLNYLVTIILGGGVAFTWVKTRTITSNVRFLWPGAVLAAIGVASFVYSRWIGDPMSYAAALVPMGLLTAGCVLRPSAHEVRSAMRIVGAALAVLACVGAAWSHALGVVSAGSMIVALLALLVAGFTGQRRLTAVLIVANAAYLVLWPSSSALVAMAAIAAFWGLRALGHVALFRMGVQLAVATLLLVNMLSMVRPQILAPLMQSETTLSEGIGQQSNSVFRIGVIRAASHDYLQASVWVGKRFTGTINATNVPAYVPWWQTDEASVHSDIAIMILQGGLVGFLLIAAWWMGLLRLLVDGTHHAGATGDQDITGFLDATLLGVLVVVVYASFNPIHQQLGMMLPLYVLVWVGALARVRRPDADGPAAAGPPRVSPTARPLTVEAGVLLALTPAVLVSGPVVWGVPAVIALLWIGLYRWTGRAWPRSSLNSPIAALLVVVGASLLFSGGRVSWAAPKVATLTLGMAWFFAVVRQHQAGVAVTWLVRGLVAVCFVLTLVGIVSTNWLDKIPQISEVTARLPQWLWFGGLHPNPVAGVLVLLAPLCLLLMARTNPDGGRTSTIERVAGGLVLLAALALVALTQSRGGWLGAAAAVTTLVLYRVPLVRAIPAAPAALAFAAACAVVGLWMFVPSVHLIGGDLDHKWLYRLELWRVGCLMIGDFPWTGVGLNGFRNLAALYPAVAYPTQGLALVHPHNMWLSAGVDLGLPGLLVVTALWLSALRIPARLAASSDRTHALIGQCVMAGWVGFWTFGIADAVPLGTKLGTAMWMSFALAACLGRKLTR